MSEVFLLLLFAMLFFMMKLYLISLLFLISALLFLLSSFLSKLFSFGKNIAQKSGEKLSTTYKEVSSASPSYPQGVFSETTKELGRIAAKDAFNQGKFWSAPQSETAFRTRLSKTFKSVWDKLFGMFK